MATAIYDAPIKEVKGETKTLSTTEQYIAIPPGFQNLKTYCASQWRLSLCPRLYYLFKYTTTYANYTAEVTDRVSTTHAPLDALAATNYIYIGCPAPFLGVQFDLDGTNKNAVTATLDVEYYNGTEWTDVAGDSDGTTSGGKTLAQDGLYSWTLPTDWAQVAVNSATCYWIRFKPSTTLSATIDLIELIPVYKEASVGEYMEGGMVDERSIQVDFVGAIGVTATASTPTLDVSWSKTK